jgi:hypothetical protein
MKRQAVTGVVVGVPHAGGNITLITRITRTERVVCG